MNFTNFLTVFPMNCKIWIAAKSNANIYRKLRPCIQSFDYLTIRKQHTTTGCHYGLWEELLFGVPQGSILEPLFYSIHLCALFLSIHIINIASYADDTKSYVYGGNIGSTIVTRTNVWLIISEVQWQSYERVSCFIISVMEFQNRRLNHKANRLHQRYFCSIPWQNFFIWKIT